MAVLIWQAMFGNGHIARLNLIHIMRMMVARMKMLSGTDACVVVHGTISLIMRALYPASKKHPRIIELLSLAFALY